MKSVSHVVPEAARVDPISVSYEQHATWSQSQLSSWSPGAVYCGDDLPGVPLDCFTSSMMDDGSCPEWVPYEHHGCDPVVDGPCSESGEGSDEEPDPMEVDQD